MELWFGSPGVVDSDPAVRTPDVEEDPGWRQAPHAAVVVAGQVVRAANARAMALFPRLAPGVMLRAACVNWLANAHEALPAGTGEPVSGVLGRRSFEAHPVDHGDGVVTWWLVDTTDARDAHEQLRVVQQRSALLDEVSTALSTALDPDRCTALVARLAADHLADAAWVITPGGRAEFPVTLCTRGETPAHSRLAVDPDELAGLAEVLEGFPPVPSRWIDPVLAPEWLVPEGFGEIGSIMVVPLPGHDVATGALVLLRHESRTAYTQDDETFAGLFAARAGFAISAARVFAARTSITRTLMRELLPATVNHTARVEFAGRHRPASDGNRIGGDLYDVHPLGVDDASEAAGWLAVFGTVSGRGLEAAILTCKVRGIVHALLPMAHDHHQMLTSLNNAMLNGCGSRFVTLVLASVTRAGPDVNVRLTSAGHLAPLVVRGDGTVAAVRTSGTLIGVLAEISAVTAEITLAAGETCLLYTDGITEAAGGPLGTEPFGEQRLREALATCADMPAEAVAEHVQMIVAEWIGRGDHDDVALLAITAPRGGSGQGRYPE